MSWLYYLLEANLYLILFFAFYYFVLHRETWYQYNRVYLLVTSALAFIIPFVQLGILKPALVVPAGQLQITQINFAPVSISAVIAPDTSWTREDYYLAAYLLIACCLLINLAVKIYKLVKLSRLNTYKKADKWIIIETDENKGAFSFFNYLFVSPQMALSETVIAHELVHIRQKHSWDIVYFEIIKVVSWFNPVAYLLQHSIKELHEFIADSEIAGDESKINQYTDFLLGNAYGVHENELTNNLFNKSLLKKRIMMLHQKRSGNSARLKYLLVLPLSAGLLCASTLAFAKSYGWIDIAPKHALSEKTLAPDLNSANKVKRLKITQGGTSAITDRISVRESKMKTGTYTVNNLTAKDEARLLKNYNIKVEVVEVDNTSITNYSEEMNYPTMVKPDNISASHKDWFNYSIDPSRYTAKMLSDMAANFKAKGYQMDFKDYKDGNASMLKISLRKSDAPNSGVSNTFRIDELKKTSDVIFLGFNKKKNLVFVHSEKIVLFPKPKAMTINMPPPPPPAEVITDSKNNGVIKTKTGKAHTILYETKTGPVTGVAPLIIVNGTKYTLPQQLKPGQYLYTHATDSTIQYKPGNAFAIQKWGDEAKNGVLELFGKTSVEVIPGKNDTINKVIREKVNKEINTKTNSIIKKEIKEGISFNMPPPWGSKPGFNGLFIYLGKNIHYPAAEYDKRIVGNVVVELTVNDNYKITNVKVMNDALPAFANEVVRAARRYADTINRAPGTYVLGVQFNLVTEKMTKSWLPKGLSNDIDDKPNFAGIIETVGYIKE